MSNRAKGGLESFVYNLAKCLVARGHEVDVFATANATIHGNLIPIFDISTFEKTHSIEEKISREIAGSVKTFQQLEKTAHTYDVIHNNQITFYAWLAAQEIPHCLSTLHITNDYRIEQALQVKPHGLKKNIVAVSDFQRKHWPFPLRTRIHLGVNLDHFTFNSQPKDYIAWLGRFDPRKGIKQAIHLTKQAKVPFKFAGSTKEIDFYNQIVEYAQSFDHTEFLGYADRTLRNSLLGSARAMLLPIQWDEPFGLVMIEAMACGTPIITYDRGSTRELIKDGVTGFICPVNDEKAMKEAIKKIMTMPEAEYQKMRQNCRDHVVKHFTLSRMVDEYEKLYQKIAQAK